MLVIFGTGGFARELVRLAQEMVSGTGEVLIFACDVPQDPVLGIPVIQSDEIGEEDKVIIAVADPQTRKGIAERLKGQSARIQPPTTLIGPAVEIGPGAVFCDYTMVTGSARIGAHFHCNIYSYVAHDCVIGDFVTFAPRVCCNGNVHIHDGAFVGAGAVIRQGTPGKPLVIGENAVIGMGAVVTKDVPANTTVVGNPARVLHS